MTLRTPVGGRAGLLRMMACLTGLGGAITCVASSGFAQDATGQAGSPVSCRGQRISRIEIDARPPFQPDGGPKIFQRITQLATQLHAVTKPSVVRRYLAVRVGDACTEIRRRESERILRAQPFLASALVMAYADGPDAVVLRVVTVDEISLIFDGHISGASPIIQGLRLGEDNLLGTATYVAGAWRNDRDYRDSYSARVVDYQFLGRPYILSAQGTRAPIGGNYEVQASHPFVTDLQRISWRVTTGATERLAFFRRPGDGPLPALEFTRSYADAGAVVAFGPVGRLLLLGMSVSREHESTGSMPVVYSDSGLVRDTSQVLMNRYGNHISTHINALVGYRRIDLMQVAGFDAVRGTHDVRRGMQVAMLVGRGVKLQDNEEPNYFVSGSAYYGFGSPRSFWAFETMGERRRNLNTKRWDGVLGSGRAAWYRPIHDERIMISSLEFSGGWRQRVPFQLSLADRDGGVRGYGKSLEGGGQRVVFRFEDRHRLNDLRSVAAVSAAWFVDAGRLWAGDVPFGMSTDMKVSAGVSLLAAFPPSSRRTWRMDLAFPINDRRDNKFQLRFSNQELTRWFWREPGDVQMARERSIPNSVYNWP